jgi:hypothetical protein
MSKNQRSFRFVVPVIFAFLVIAISATATSVQAQHAPGDIAFTGYHSFPNDKFSFVLLKNFTAGQTINFTDAGWITSLNRFDTDEGLIVWTVPAGGLVAGKELTISFVANTVILSGGGAAGSIVISGIFGLNNGGDQIYAFTGTQAAPTSVLAGLHMNTLDIPIFFDLCTTTDAIWDGACSNNNNAYGALPTGGGLNTLTGGTNALWIGTASPSPVTEWDNARFNCASVPRANIATVAGARAAVNNKANWVFNNDANPNATTSLPPGCGFLNLPSAAPATISGVVTTSDGSPLAGVTVNLSGGDLSGNARTITDGNGQYRFENVKTGDFYTVTPARANYNFGPAQRSFSQLGQNTDATFTASSNGGGLNPLDTPEYFVRQHYLDFLGREPDQSGFNFWSDQILECGADAGCVERRTINVSAAYFLSIEFQETGGLVDGLYRASYGRAPHFAEFMPDTRTVAQNVVVGQGPWAETLAANKQEFVDAWVQRPAFRAAYDGLSSSDFVEALISHTGVSFSQAARAALVSSLNNQTATRAEVLREVAENDQFMNAKRNEAFVMMQYFGYLRRDPDAGGYAFWLNKLNEFNGNFERAEMVRAFMVSGEFRDRFAR